MKLDRIITPTSKIGTLVTGFACLGLFQARSVGLAAVSLLCLMAAAAAALPFAVRRPRLPVLILLVYLLYVLLNLTVHGSFADLASADFLRYDGKFLPTLVVFVGATLFFDAFRRASPFWTAIAGILGAALLVLPASALFGEEKGGLLIGFFTSHNALAGSAGAVTLLVITLQAEIRRRMPALVAPLAAVGAVSMYLFLMAGSRAFLLGFACAVVYLVARSGLSVVRKVVIASFTFVMLVVLIATSPAADRLSYDYLQEDANLLTRLEYWARAADYAMQSPIIGVGIGSFNDDSLLLESPAPGIAVRTESSKFFGENHAHNIVLHLLAEQGLVGILLLSWFWASLLFRQPPLSAALARQQQREFLAMRRCVRALFVFVLAASMLGNNLLTMSTSFVFYLVAAGYVTSTSRRQPHLPNAMRATGQSGVPRMIIPSSERG